MMYLFLAFMVNFVWALSYPISKIILRDINPWALTCWRMLLSAAILLLTINKKDWLFLIKQCRDCFSNKEALKDLGWFVAMGLIGSLGATALQYIATEITLASNVSLIVAMETIIIVVISNLIFKESLGLSRVLSLCFAFIGVLLITVDPKSLDLISSQYFLGNSLMVLSIVCYSLYSLIGKHLSQRWSASLLTSLPFLIAAFIVIPAYWTLDPAGFTHQMDFTRYSSTTWWSLIYLTVFATAITYYIWNWLVFRIPVGHLSYSLYTQPIVGTLISWLFFGEPLGITYLFGAGLILISISFEQYLSLSNVTSKSGPVE